MILKGNQRGHGRDLALHLLNVDDNEHVILHELRGFVAEDLLGAFKEAEAISSGTKCQQFLFSLSLNPPPDTDVPIAAFEAAIARIEAKLGLKGQPRAIVFHEKHARRHAHCVWSRINPQTMRAVNLPHFKRKLQEVARELYRTHGWEMPAGFVTAEERDLNSFDRVDAAQAKSAARDPKALKAFFRDAWARSDSQAGFAAALREDGFILAQGARRAFVAVDAEGNVYSLSRWTGAGAKALRQRMGTPDGLPTVSQAAAQLGKQPERAAPAKSRELRAMVARQRAERRARTRQHAERAKAETWERRRQLPTGLKAMWARVTRTYQALLDDLQSQAETRRAKDKTDWDALIAKHLAERRALQAQIDHDRAFASLTNALHPTALPSDPRQRLRLPPDDLPPSALTVEFRPEAILDHLSAKSESFSDAEIRAALKAVHDDDRWLDDLQRRLRRSEDLVSLSSNGEPRFTTRSFLTAQIELRQSAVHLTRRKTFSIAPKHVATAIIRENTKLAEIGAKLSDQQIDALHYVTGTSALSCVVGYAGAGKSTLLRAAHAAWQAQGYHVFGLALAGKAADGLEAASGIASRTIASLETSWKNGFDPIAPGSVVVIDEVGMVGTRQLNRVLSELSHRGCKAVLVGDPDQLQPIEAGTPFRDLLVRHDNVALTEIRRQREDWQRAASVKLASGEVADALALYHDRGLVKDHADRNRAIRALAEDYLTDLELQGSDQSRLALAHRRKDVFALNQAIRAGRVAVGDLTDDMLVETDHGPRAFAAGDRILLTCNDKGFGVRNGMLGTVQSISGAELRIALDETGRTVELDARTYRALDHGYAVSIHKSQGCTVDRSFVLDGPTMDPHLTYVAATRHREEMRFYRCPMQAKEWSWSSPLKVVHQLG